MNIAIIGPDNTGKTTLINSIIKKEINNIIGDATLVPQVYIEDEKKESKLKEKIDIANDQHNNIVIRRTKNETITYEEINPKTEFKIEKLTEFHSLPEDIKLRIYDVPAYNDSKLSDLYMQYINNNINKWNIIILVLDIHRPIIKESDIKKFEQIIRLIKKNRESNCLDTELFIIANKVDDLDFTKENGLTIINEEYLSRYDVMKESLDLVINKEYKGFRYYIMPMNALDAYIYRMYFSNDNFKLNNKCLNRIGHNEFGKAKWNRFTPEEKKKKVKDIMKELNIDESLHITGFNYFKYNINKFLSKDRQYQIIINKYISECNMIIKICKEYYNGIDVCKGSWINDARNIKYDGNYLECCIKSVSEKKQDNQQKKQDNQQKKQNNQQKKQSKEINKKKKQKQNGEQNIKDTTDEALVKMNNDDLIKMLENLKEKEEKCNSDVTQLTKTLNDIREIKKNMVNKITEKNKDNSILYTFRLFLFSHDYEYYNDNGHLKGIKLNDDKIKYISFLKKFKIIYTKILDINKKFQINANIDIFKNKLIELINLFKYGSFTSVKPHINLIDQDIEILNNAIKLCDIWTEIFGDKLSDIFINMKNDNIKRIYGYYFYKIKNQLGTFDELLKMYKELHTNKIEINDIDVIKIFTHKTIIQKKSNEIIKELDNLYKSKIISKQILIDSIKYILKSTYESVFKSKQKNNISKNEIFEYIYMTDLFWNNIIQNHSGYKHKDILNLSCMAKKNLVLLQFSESEFNFNDINIFDPNKYLEAYYMKICYDIKINN